MKFSDFLANDTSKKMIEKTIRSGDVLGSYVFAGDEGIGKKTLSHIFISSLFCNAKDGVSACGMCPDCAKVISKNHPDILYVTKQKDKKTIGVEEVREQIIKQAYVKPFIANRKIFIIEDGDALTQEAQNALLKILEEPPSYVTFVTLVKSTGSLLDTVLSRSLVFRLKPVSKEGVKTFLKKKYPDVTDDDISLASSFSQGIIGKAEKMLNCEDFKALFFETQKHIDAICESLEAIVSFEKFILDNKENVSDLIEFMLLCLRDRILKSCGAADLAFMHGEENGGAKKWIGATEVLLKYKSELYSNVNFTISTLDMLKSLQREFNIN